MDLLWCGQRKEQRQQQQQQQPHYFLSLFSNFFDYFSRRRGESVLGAFTWNVGRAGGAGNSRRPSSSPVEDGGGSTFTMTPITTSNRTNRTDQSTILEPGGKNDKAAAITSSSGPVRASGTSANNTRTCPVSQHSAGMWAKIEPII
jgi:hypothetical protein